MVTAIITTVVITSKFNLFAREFMLSCAFYTPSQSLGFCTAPLWPRKVPRNCGAPSAPFPPCCALAPLIQRRLPTWRTRSEAVLDSWGCCCRVPRAPSVKQQEFLVSRSCRLEAGGRVSRPCPLRVPGGSALGLSPSFCAPLAVAAFPRFSYGGRSCVHASVRQLPLRTLEKETNQGPPAG